MRRYACPTRGRGILDGVRSASKKMGLPTGFATRVLLGAPGLLDHARSPHANKQWRIMAFRLQRFDSAWGCR